MPPKKPHLMETIADDATIVEGKAKISFEKGKVFYNPVQEFNRDLSVAAISVYQGLANRPQGLAIAECLSATGLRSIRYGLEIDGVSKIVANDIDPSATQIICKNVRDNGLEGKIQVNTQDAKYHRWMLFSFFLHAFRASNCLFDVVDLDPYGSSSPFIDSAVQAIASGGLLCATCTDMAVLCATYPETCYGKYGSVPIKGDACHEMALRIVLSLLDRSAAKYKRFAKPLLSVTVDFYLRVFVRIFEKPSESKLCLA